MARKLQKPTVSEVKKFLASAAFDINDRDKPMLSLAVSDLTPRYLRTRATEYIAEARAIMEGTIQSANPVEAHKERIRMAIGLLAIAALREP
jgi:hypothetical protein